MKYIDLLCQGWCKACDKRLGGFGTAMVQWCGRNMEKFYTAPFRRINCLVSMGLQQPCVSVQFIKRRDKVKHISTGLIGNTRGAREVDTSGRQCYVYGVQVIGLNFWSIFDEWVKTPQVIRNPRQVLSRRCQELGKQFHLWRLVDR